jgi:hypothetical protein
MKKILSLILSIALFLTSLSLIVSCTKNDSVGTATIVIGTEEEKVYTVPLSELSEGKGLMPAFEYLKANEGLEYDITGTMMNSIGGLENDYVLGRYIYIYTSVEADFDVSEYRMEMDYNGKTLVSAGVGFDEMTLTDGAIVYIGLISWG